MRMLGKLLCWMGLHDWYEGLVVIYCVRRGCNACIDKNIKDILDDDR